MDVFFVRFLVLFKTLLLRQCVAEESIGGIRTVRSFAVRRMNMLGTKRGLSCISTG